ncbi:hypothetical protein M758_UG065300 [Ceratodon purpureus]|nr:hypothetical protein M758_UG065300 [Ceratodon purpureus]
MVSSGLGSRRSWTPQLGCTTFLFSGMAFLTPFRRDGRRESITSFFNLWDERQLLIILTTQTNPAVSKLQWQSSYLVYNDHLSNMPSKNVSNEVDRLQQEQQRYPPKA